MPDPVCTRVARVMNITTTLCLNGSHISQGSNTLRELITKVIGWPCAQSSSWVEGSGKYNTHNIILHPITTRGGNLAKDHGICKSCINYSIAYPKPQNKRYCSQYMIAIVVLKPN